MSEPATIQPDVDNNKPADETVVEDEKVLLDEDGNEIIEDEDVLPVSDRDQVMLDLAAKRRRQNQGLPLEEEIIEDENDPPHAADKPPVEDDKVVLKVNGQEIIKTQAEVDAAGGVAAIQKSLAGDMKLAEAAKERKALEEERAEIKRLHEENLAKQEELNAATQQLQDLINQQAAKGEMHTEESQEARKAKAKEISSQIFVGDPESLEKAVEELLAIADRTPAPAKVAPAPVIDTNEIASRVATIVEREADRKKAVDLFEKEHSDLATPGRRKYVNDLTVAVGTEHPEWMPSQIIEEAISRTREELGIPKPESDPVDTLSVLHDKKTSKRRSVNKVPQASARKKRPASSKNKPKTRRQIFDEMYGARSHA